MQKLEQDIARIRARDASLFSDDPLVQAAIEVRLGWTDLPWQAPELAPLLENLAQMADERDIADVVLIGMGGSSLAAYVFADAHSDQLKRPLHVLDSTCPDDIIDLVSSLDFSRTLFIVASKSGTTLETVTLEALLWELAGEAMTDQSARAANFIAITDPDTPLAQRALQRGYRLIESPADVGGRFSAFSVYGLVPSALVGVDTEKLIFEAQAAQAMCEASDRSNPAVRLASELWHYYQSGDDKLPLPDEALSLWLEQMIAESLGKEGKGIIPFLKPLTCCCSGHIMPCPDSSRSLDDPVLARYGGITGCCMKHDVARPTAPVAQSMVVWMWATSLLGVLMGINPYDQPNIAEAKESILEVLADPHPQHWEVEVTDESIPLSELLAAAHEDDYVSILAYVTDQEYEQIKAVYLPRLASLISLPLCLEQGPRYLHSRRQLHEGGPNTGVFIAIDNHAPDSPNIALPQTDYTLRELFDAQRIGDVIALRDRDRRVTMTSIESILSES
ncbi:MAG: hypothetical protein FWD41_01530 [Actinomycetia bacterium]|nr:hypothetical protein [Actinomycetes bacterium]